MVRILKSPGVEERRLRVPQRPGERAEQLPPGNGRAGQAERDWASAGAAADGPAAEARSRVERAAAAVLSRARRQAEAVVGEARAEVERLRAAAAELRGVEAQLEEARSALAAAEAARNEAQLAAEAARRQAAERSERIVAEAQTQAAAAIEQAAAQADELEAEARERGLAQGREDGLMAGRSEAYAELAGRLETAASVAAQARSVRVRVLEQAEPAIVELALDVARQVVGQEVQADRMTVARMVAKGLQKLAAGAQAQVRVNPDDYHALADQWAELQRRYVDRGVQVLPDPAVGPGGCLIDTRSGTIDGRIDTQFEQIERTLMTLAGA